MAAAKQAIPNARPSVIVPKAWCAKAAFAKIHPPSATAVPIVGGALATIVRRTFATVSPTNASSSRQNRVPTMQTVPDGPVAKVAVAATAKANAFLWASVPPRPKNPIAKKVKSAMTR